MKEKFVSPEIEIIKFTTEDVIVASGDNSMTEHDGAPGNSELGTEFPF